VLATVLFTDIVGSTERAGRLGDRRWRELLDVHEELARRVVEQFQGQLVKTTGDGILATFDGPGRGSAARPRSETSCAGLAPRSGQGCTLARSSYATVMSAGSPCTLPRG
jgi:class 3 adenylate cyclase